MWQPNTSLAWSCMNSLWGRARRIDSAPDATMGILEILSARWSASFSNQEQNITMTQTSRQLGLHWSTDTSYLSNRHSWNSIMYFGQRIHQILGQIVMIVDDWLLLVLSLFCIARDLKARSFDCSPWQRNCSFWWAVSVQYLLLGTFLSERKIYQQSVAFCRWFDSNCTALQLLQTYLRRMMKLWMEEGILSTTVKLKHMLEPYAD